MNQKSSQLSTSVVVAAYCLALSLVIIDQYSKWLAEKLLSEVGTIYVTPLLNWTLSYNSGAAFGLLSQFGGQQRWFLAILSLSVSLLLIYWIPQQTRRLSLLSMTLILGGALGNAIDRIATGAVIDFISIHYQQYYFAIFNIADCAISIGAILLVIDMFTDTARKT